MNIKKYLPIFFVVAFITGVILQPGMANSAQEPTNIRILSPADVITVCTSGICNYTTIQEAITNAADGDTIQLSAETFTEALDFTAPIAITITGFGAEDTIIQAHANPLLSTERVMDIGSQSSLNLDGVTIRHGYSAAEGGGIRNRGTMTVTNSVITNNTAANGGGIANSPIINEQATLVISNTTISYNNASQGAGIFNSAPMDNSVASTLVGNSALMNNVAQVAGGGISNISLASNNGTATLTIFNVTLSNNSVEDENVGVGAGIYNEASGTNEAITSVRQSTFAKNSAKNGDHFHVESGTFALKSSILVGSDKDCSGEPFTNEGYNLVENASCGMPVDGLLGIDNDPADNGGDTLTYALIHYSPALDLVPLGECVDITDQRGVARPYGAGCDSGSFELNATSLTLEQRVVGTNVKPGEIISFTITAQLTGPGISNGILKTNVPENLTILENVELDPPGSGIISSTPPTVTHSIVISANQMITVTMYAEVALGLPIGTTINHEVSLTSNEITVPEMDLVILSVINAPPVAVDDGGLGFTTDPNTILITGNVLGNDYDPNNDPLTFNGLNSVVQPRGAVVYNGDGTFTYDPNHKFDKMIPGQTYYDTFQYLITDGNGGFSNWATVTVVVHKESDFIYLPIAIK